MLSHLEKSIKTKAFWKCFVLHQPVIEKNNLTRLGDTSAKWKVSTSLVTLSVRYLKNIRSATWPRSLSPMSKLSTSGPGCWLHISLMCAIVWSWQWWLKSRSELFFFEDQSKISSFVTVSIFFGFQRCCFGIISHASLFFWGWVALQAKHLKHGG